MKVHLVRHARTVSRVDWSGPRADDEPALVDFMAGELLGDDPRECDLSELLRPLSQAGRIQAEALAEHLLDDTPRRLLSSPALRCQQTLEPLALALGLPVEVDDRLGDGEALSGVTELIRDVGDAQAVICTHSASIRDLLELLELGDELEATGPVCRKGSLWTLEGSSDFTLERASYVQPTRGRKARRSASKLRRELARPQSIRAAVLDMGSTSFTLLIADVARNGVIQPIVREKVMLRLGAAITRNGKIPSSIAREAVEVARQLHQTALPEKVEYFLPVATAALRDAVNGQRVADKIARAIGEPVRILAGESEARLMFGAFQQRLSLGDEPVLGLDLGGGSLEHAVGCGERIDGECTLGLGAVKLHGELVKSDPMRPREARRIRERAHRAIEPHRDELLRRGPERIIVAGGTPRAIAQLIAAERGSSSAGDSLPMEINLGELRKMAKRLVRSDHDERLAMPGVRRRRADLVATGALVLVGVAESLGLRKLTFSDWGLREGLLLELIANAGPRRVGHSSPSISFAALDTRR